MSEDTTYANQRASPIGIGTSPPQEQVAVSMAEALLANIVLSTPAVRLG